MLMRLLHAPREALLLSLLVLAACAQPARPHPERWARAWIWSVNTHRFREVDALLAPDAVYEDPLSGGPLRGADIVYYFGWFWAANPNARFAIARVTGDAHTAVVEWTVTGISGRPLLLKGKTVLQIDGDKITSVRGN
jgi:hypothetical protein